MLLWSGLWPFFAGIGLALAMNLFVGPAAGPFVAGMLIDVGIMIVLAVSLNIVNGFTGQFSIGNAGFFALGGYLAGAVTYYGSLFLWDSPARHGDPFGSGEWLFAAACLAGGLFAAGAGYVVGLPSLRLRGDYLAIVTLGFGEIIRVVLQQTNPVLDADEVKASTWRDWVPPPVGGSLGFTDIPKYASLFWVYLFVSLTVLAAFRLKRSSIGRGMIAVREDELAAQAMGVDVTRRKVGAFVISALFAGIAGGLFAHKRGAIISPQDAGFQRSIEIVIMAVLGGKGSISGVTMAAAILTVLPEFLRDFEQYRLIVYSLLLIGMMLLRPQGLMGTREVWELFGRRPADAKTPEAT